MKEVKKMENRPLFDNSFVDKTLPTTSISTILGMVQEPFDQKGVAQKIVYDAFAIVEAKLEKPALEAFQEALENIMPVLECKARRVGGSTYQVPMEVRAERRQTLGLRWITVYSRQRSERTMAERLANEILDAINSVGGAVKKKEEMHRMAEANKAFAHYRY